MCACSVPLRSENRKKPGVQAHPGVPLRWRTPTCGRYAGFCRDRGGRFRAVTPESRRPEYLDATSPRGRGEQVAGGRRDVFGGNIHGNLTR